MTREARHALLRFAAWAILGGVVAGGLSWWLRGLPVVGASAQFAFIGAMGLFGLQLLRGMKAMERERRDFERLRLECEQAQLEVLRGAMRGMKEEDLLRSQVGVVEIPPESWLQ